jgi:hypothetical protein
LTKAYRKLQLASNAQDFTDLILLANKFMAEGKLKPIKATHLLSDETQDIDQMQYDWLMHHVAQGAVLTAVGDDDQSIYGFRRSLGYKGMMDIVSATGAKIVTLDTNYRSTAGIVESASKLIAYNADRVQKNIKAARGAGPIPRVISLSKLDSQAMRIVQALDKVCAKNEVPEPLPNREPYRFGVKAGQVAVLARPTPICMPLRPYFGMPGTVHSYRTLVLGCPGAAGVPDHPRIPGAPGWHGLRDCPALGPHYGRPHSPDHRDGRRQPLELHPAGQPRPAPGDPQCRTGQLHQTRERLGREALRQRV